jgi:hypothetical protein
MATQLVKDIELEIKTVQAIAGNSYSVVYYLKYLFTFLPFNTFFDRNLFLALDYAKDTGRDEFLKKLKEDLDAASTRGERLTKERFAEILLKNFNQSAAQSTIKDSGLKLIKTYINRYLDQNGLGSTFKISKTDLKLDETGKTYTSQQLEQDKKSRDKKRNYKIVFTVLSLILAVLVAFPEAALALYGGGIFTVGVIMIVGLPAFLVSYFLFRKAIYDYFKKFFFSSSDEEFADLSKAERVILNLILLFTGLTMGFLLFNSMFVPFGIIFFGFGSAAAVMAGASSVPVLFLISAVLSLVSVLANMALFKNYCYGTYRDLKQYFKNMTWEQFFSINTLVFVLASITVVVAQLWFYSESIKFFNQLLGFSINYSTFLAGAFSVLGILNGIFYGKNLYLACGKIIDTAKWVCNIENLKNGYGLLDLWRNRGKLFSDSLENKRRIKKVFAYVIFAGLIYCCNINADAVGTGVAALVNAGIAIKGIVYGLISFASFTGNSNAAMEEVLPASAPVADVGETTGVAVARYCGYKYTAARTPDVASASEELEVIVQLIAKPC